jgi:hypothetical protein
MTQSAIGTALLLAASSWLLGGCFGPDPGYGHREVVYAGHDHDHQEHHEDHHEGHHDQDDHGH